MAHLIKKCGKNRKVFERSCQVCLQTFHSRGYTLASIVNNTNANGNIAQSKELSQPSQTVNEQTATDKDFTDMWRYGIHKFNHNQYLRQTEEFKREKLYINQEINNVMRLSDENLTHRSLMIAITDCNVQYSMLKQIVNDKDHNPLPKNTYLSYDDNNSSVFQDKQKNRGYSDMGFEGYVYINLK